MAEKTKRIALGSGRLFLKLFEGTLPSIEELKKEVNELAKIKNGASLEYTMESFTEKSDDGTVQKTVVTDEVAKLKPGIITVDSNLLTHIISTARVATTDDTDRTVVKIGGTNNDDGKSYALLFYSEDKKDGDIAVLIVGKNTAGLSFAFKKSEGTLLEPEFTAEPQDDEGTLIQIVFFHPKNESEAAAASVEDETSPEEDETY